VASELDLAIIPDLTHYESGASPLLAPTVLPFLNATGPGEPARK
jgi:hypothetical protein